MTFDEMKFQIGDVLTHAGSIVRGRALPESARFVVIGRMLEECPGGIQQHYRCRVVVDSISTGLGVPSERAIDFLDVELRRPPVGEEKGT